MTIPALPPASGTNPDNVGVVTTAPDGAPAAREPDADAPAHPDMPLEHLSVTELLKLHTRIEALLPALSLQDVSLEKTLMLQLLAAQELQREVVEDKGATPTQKSQVTNTLSGVIDTLSKLQIKLFSSERMKDIEAVLIDTVNEHMTPEQQVFFMTEYRRRLGAADE